MVYASRYSRRDPCAVVLGPSMGSAAQPQIGRALEAFAHAIVPELDVHEGPKPSQAHDGRTTILHGPEEVDYKLVVETGLIGVKPEDRGTTADDVLAADAVGDSNTGP